MGISLDTLGIIIPSTIVALAIYKVFEIFSRYIFGLDQEEKKLKNKFDTVKLKGEFEDRKDERAYQHEEAGQRQRHEILKEFVGKVSNLDATDAVYMAEVLNKETTTERLELVASKVPSPNITHNVSLNALPEPKRLKSENTM